MLYMYEKFEEFEKKKVQQEVEETKQEVEETKEKARRLVKKVQLAAQAIDDVLNKDADLESSFKGFQRVVENNGIEQIIAQQLATKNIDGLSEEQVIKVATIKYIQLQAQRGDSKASELLQHFNSPEITAGVEGLKQLFPTLEQNLADLVSPSGLSESFDQKTQEFARYGEGIEGYEASIISFNNSLRRKFSFYLYTSKTLS